MKRILTAGITAVMMYRACELTGNYAIALTVAVVISAISTVAMDELFGAKKRKPSQKKGTDGFQGVSKRYENISFGNYTTNIK